MVKVEEFKDEKGLWLREEDEEGNTIKEFFIPKEKEMEKVEHGSQLEEYEELAKEGEPVPDKYYKWKNSGKEKKFKFVLQRHYPTGKKEPIKPGEKIPEMHKGFVVEYDEENPEAFEEFLTNFIEDLKERDEVKKSVLADTIQEAYKSSEFGCRPALFFFDKICKDTTYPLLKDLIEKIRDHLDLRMSIDDRLIGITIHPPVPGENTSWDTFKEQIESGKANLKTSITPKYEHPIDWLNEEGELRFPTRHTRAGEKLQEAHYLEVARIDVIDSGEVQYGVQRKDLHEYFFSGKQLKGRWVLRRLKIGKEYKHEVWLFMKPEDQKPLDPKYHRDQSHYEIDFIRAPTTEQRQMIEEETQRARAERE